MSSAALVRDGQALPWEQYAALPEDPRVEYVDGRLLVSPSPTRAHQEICYRLVALVKAVLPAGWAVTAAWAWKPGPDEYIPDVMVHPVTDELVRFTGVPALCVEVLSGNRGDDLVLTTTRYARAGLPRYWIVDPRDGQLSAYTLHEGLYQRTAQLDTGDDPSVPTGSTRRARLDLGPVEVDVDLDALLGP